MFDRRAFLQLLGAQLALYTPSRIRDESVLDRSWLPGGGPARRRTSDVVVVGAGAFGGWSANYLRELGASVTLVDAYGPGNSRATSGDETRGIQIAHEDKHVYTRWAIEAIERWKAWDDRYGRGMKRPLFMQPGRLIVRSQTTPDMQQSKELLDLYGARNEVLDHDELVRRFPQINMEGMEAGLFEPDAGVIRARQACETVAEVFQAGGGAVVAAHAGPGRAAGGRLQDVVLSTGERLSADAFVFACGPWLRKIFPEVMGARLMTTTGHVAYVGIDPGDPRFTAPLFPSYSVPDGTGWPTFWGDHRGVRVRSGGGGPADPDTVDRAMPQSGLQQLRSFTARWFPALKDNPILETRVCVYERSIDLTIIVDRHPDYENLWIVGGGSGRGFKMGPVLGEYVAKRILDLEDDGEARELFRLKPETFDST
jgi:sarcosine oxidase